MDKGLRERLDKFIENSANRELRRTLYNVLYSAKKIYSHQRSVYQYSDLEDENLQQMLVDYVETTPLYQQAKDVYAFKKYVLEDIDV